MRVFTITTLRRAAAIVSEAVDNCWLLFVEHETRNCRHSNLLQHFTLLRHKAHTEWSYGFYESWSLRIKGSQRLFVFDH